MNEISSGITRLKQLRDGRVRLRIGLLPEGPDGKAEAELSVVLPADPARPADRMAQVELEALRCAHSALMERMGVIERALQRLKGQRP